MNQDQYSALCRDTCLALKISDPESLASEGHLVISETKIYLMFDEIFSGDCILCVCDIGDVQEDLRERVFESLLMLNYLTGGKTTGVYAIDPFSQRASFVVTLLNPDSLSGPDLASLLSRYASRSAHLKKTLLASGDLHLPLDDDLAESSALIENFRMA